MKRDTFTRLKNDDEEKNGNEDNMHVTMMINLASIQNSLAMFYEK